MNVSGKSTANPPTPIQSRPTGIKPWVGAGHILLPIPAALLVSVSVCVCEKDTCTIDTVGKYHTSTNIHVYLRVFLYIYTTHIYVTIHI